MQLYCINPKNAAKATAETEEWMKERASERARKDPWHISPKIEKNTFQYEIWSEMDEEDNMKTMKPPNRRQINILAVIYRRGRGDVNM